MQNIELVAPALSPEMLDAAIGEGADGVYMGLTNFTFPQCEGALRSLHRMGRKLYIKTDRVFEQREADRMYQLLKYLHSLGPDGVMVQDLGMAAMAREEFPALKLQASVQMNAASARGVNLLSRQGFSRVILARQLSLKEIGDIRALTNMDLGVYVQGATCISASGLCLFSSFLGGKSANRGICTQACRRHYIAHAENEGDEGYAVQERGDSYFYPGDQQLIDDAAALAQTGVNALLIDGRMRGADYVGAAVSAYRLVLDSLEEDEEDLQRAIAHGREILQGAAKKALEGRTRSRRYNRVMPQNLSSFKRVPGKDKAPPLVVHEKKGEAPSIKAKAGKKDSKKQGASLELPDGIYTMVSKIEDLYILQSARPAKAILPLNRKLRAQLLEARGLPFPPRDIILFLDPFFAQEEAEELEEDISALMAKSYTSYIINNLGHVSLFRRGMDPQARALLIAGPWLYAFNGWAWNFLSGSGLHYCISPLENNRQNLEKTFPGSMQRSTHGRNQVLVPVFARPSLFRIPRAQDDRWDFQYFSDSQEGVFRLTPSPEGYLVYPQLTFSILDKIPFLTKAGFTKFFMDFSDLPLKKAEYREIMEAVKISAPLRGVSRFNWKNGFYNQEEKTQRQEPGSPALGLRPES